MNIKEYSLKILVLSIVLILFTSCFAPGVDARTRSRSSSKSFKGTTSTSTTSSKSTSRITSKSGKTYKKPSNFTSKYNSDNVKTEVVNSSPSRYTSYSSDSFFKPNFWTVMFAFACMHRINENGKVEDVQASEQDIARELEERGYTKEEVDEILAEGRQAQEAVDLDEKMSNQVAGVLFIVLIIAIGAALFAALVFFLIKK